METTIWQRGLIIAAFVTIIFVLLLCFAASSTPVCGLEAASDSETPWPGAAASHEDGALSGKADPIGDGVLVEPMPTPDPDEYEPDNAKHQARRISMGGPQTHNFQRFDEDWVKFWAWAGNNYTIRTFDLQRGCNTVLCLRDAVGMEIPGVPCDDDGGEERRASRIDWTPDESGIYFVEVLQANPSVGGNLSYTVAISEVVRCRDRFEPDDTPENAEPTTEDPRTFHGPCGGDVDWASFEAVGGQVYSIWTSDLRGNNDTVLGLYDAADAARQKLAENDDYADDVPASRIVWQAPADGTYLVRISPFEPTTGGCDLGYTLHLDTLAAMPTPTPTPTPALPADEPDPHEPDGAMYEANRIAVNGGAVEDYAFHHDGDEDWVKFWAWACYTYTIKTEVGPGTDTTLELYDLDRKKLKENDDDPDNPPASRIDWHAPENGSYYVRVAPPDANSVRHRSLASPFGLTYSLAISETIPCREEEYEPDNGPDQAKPIIVDGDPQHRCFYVPCFDRYHPPDTADWVKFQAQAGITYEIRTFDLTSRTDTVLVLYDTDYVTVTVNDDYADDGLASKIIWQAPRDGTYYVEASPFDSRIGGCDVCYSLEVTRSPSYIYLPLILKPPNLPPYPPSDPTPAPGATDQPLDVDLSWSGGDPDEGDEVFYDVYLGTGSPPAYRDTIGPYPASQTRITYDPGPLRGGTLYHWFVEVRDDGEGRPSRGPEEGWWDFITCACPDEREPDNDIDQCLDWPALEPSKPVIGYICQEHIHLEDGNPVERDWYWFEIDKLHDIEVDLEVPDGVNYDLLVWVGVREGPRCVGHWERSEDSTPGADEHVSWSAECTDRYYVVVKSLGDYDNCNPYTLHVTLK